MPPRTQSRILTTLVAASETSGTVIRMRRLRHVLLLAASAALLGCGGGEPDSAPQTTSAQSDPAPTSELPGWQQVVPTVGGGEIDLADFAGETVLFWFWAPY